MKCMRHPSTCKRAVPRIEAEQHHEEQTVRLRLQEAARNQRDGLQTVRGVLNAVAKLMKDAPQNHSVHLHMHDVAVTHAASAARES